MNVRIHSIVWLRAFAALSVSWFHFTQGNTLFLEPGFLKSTGTYGWLGVEIFFIVSGFIIPWSLYRAKYNISQYGRFILKRLIRIEPVYITSIFVIIALNYLSSLSPQYQGEVFHLDFKNIGLHLLYLNAFTDQTWLNPVYWTLAVEFQYYLMIGIIFPVLFSKNIIIRIFSFCFLIAIFYLSSDTNLNLTIIRYIPLFLIGLNCCQKWYRLISTRELIFYLSITLLLSNVYQPFFCIIGLTAVLILFKLDYNHRVANFMSEISYSIYLLHVPIGGRVINLMLRFVDHAYERVAVLLLAMALTLICSYLFYLAIERPCMRFSKKIRYQTGFSG